MSSTGLHRLVQEAGEEIASFGKARATKYAAVRLLAGRFTERSLPLFAVDEEGAARPVDTMTPLWPRGTLLAREGQVFEGLPYFLDDVRPQGFLGRAWARRHAASLGLPEKLEDWGSDAVLAALLDQGEDLPGNLILGDRSFDRWQRAYARAPEKPVSEGEKEREYPLRAQGALGAAGGSSVGGDQPKFTAWAETPEGPRHLIVKFSGPVAEPAGRRWADLLIAEHLALEAVAEAGLAEATESRIVEAGGRLFLEAARFDRVGWRGRKGVVSLHAVDAEHLGLGSAQRRWSAAAEALVNHGLLPPEDGARARALDAFGALIANTDRHFGNLAFFHEPGARVLRLAPAYDMLPMLYAPIQGQLVDRVFEPGTATAATLEAWREALPVARMYWAGVSADARVSKEFRSIAVENAEALDQVRI